MVLPAQESVLIQGLRDMDLVTGGAELGRLMKRFQVCPFVEGGFRFDHLPVDEGEQWRIAQRERIKIWLTDQELGIPSWSWNRLDGVTDGTGNPRLRSGIIDVVVGWAVKSAAEERHRIVATCTESSCMDIAISGQ